MKKLFALLILAMGLSLQAGTLVVTNNSSDLLYLSLWPNESTPGGTPYEMPIGDFYSFAYSPGNILHMMSEGDVEAFNDLPEDGLDYTWNMTAYPSMPDWQPVVVPEPTTEAFMIYCAGVVCAYCLTRQLKPAT